MRLLNLLIAVLCLAALLFLPACGTRGGRHHTAPITAPSTGQVKADIGRAEASVGAAQASSRRVGDGLARTRSYASRIDGKAAVILEHWH